MKLNKMYLCLTMVFLNCTLVWSQEERISWVTTAFWTAPQIMELSPVIKIEKEADLNKSCLEYKRRLASLSLPEEAYIADIYRTRDSFSSDGSFMAKFYLTSLEESYQVNPGFVIDLASEKLPFYTQQESVTSANLDEKTIYRINAKGGSFTSISRTLKLEDSEYNIAYEKGEAVLKIFGKDLACDLLAGNISFEITTSSFVRINNQAYDKMMQFYLNHIQPDLSSITTPLSADDQTVKAAKLGFRFGNHIENHVAYGPRTTERQIENLMNTLFIPGTLKNSSEVLNSVDGKKKEIQVSPFTIGKPVKIYIKY
jgi:hypothetical protein